MAVGIMGIGDMGSGIARDLLKNGCDVLGVDLLAHRKADFADMSGQGSKAGVPGEVIHSVFGTSSTGVGVVNNALEKIIDRQFEGTGNHINTMQKDLTISLGLGNALGVPLHTAAAEMQVLHAGRTRCPDGDNWVCTHVIDEIVGAALHRHEAKKTR